MPERAQTSWALLLMILWIVPSPSAAQGAAGPSAGSRGPSSERRMFDVRSRPAWERVQARLKELGLSTDKTDRENQALLTNWAEPDAKGLEWLATPKLPEPYVAKRIRFEVFVSPFVEPARVSVGSLAEATKAGSHASTATIYNLAPANQALMEQLARALGAEGRAIPAERWERRRMTLSVLGDEADECVRGTSPGKRAAVTGPRKIPLSEFEVLYPAPARSDGKEGSVQVGFTVEEDGSVASGRLLSPALGHQLDGAALGAVSLLLYSPARMGRCPVAATITYTVRYHQER